MNPDASSVQSEEELHFSNVSFASVSPLRPCNSQAATDKSVDKTLQESESYEESFFCGDGDFQIDVEKLVTKRLCYCVSYVFPFLANCLGCV